MVLGKNFTYRFISYRDNFFQIKLTITYMKSLALHLMTKNGIDIQNHFDALEKEFLSTIVLSEKSTFGNL